MEERETSLAIPNQEGTVNIPNKYLGDMSFIRYRMDKDRGIFTNSVTGEEKSEILARICGVKLERVYLNKGELICASRDLTTSKDGVLCAVCPKMNESPFFTDDESRKMYEAACKDNGLDNPPPYAPKAEDGKLFCNLRLVVQWVEEFEKDADGKLTWIQQPGICTISCGATSIIAMTSRATGYLAKLKSKGYNDLRYVVTKIGIGSRKSGKDKAAFSYSYETFDMEGLHKNVIATAVNYEEMKGNLPMLEQLANEVAGAGRKPQELAQKAVPASRQVVEGSVATEKAPEAPKLPPTPPVQKPAAPVKPATPPPAPVAQAPTGQAAPAAPATPPATGPSPIAMKLRIKTIYAKIPADIQVLVADILKSEAGVEDINNIPDANLKVALETLETAAKECGVAPAETTQNQTPPPPATGGTRKW